MTAMLALLAALAAGPRPQKPAVRAGARLFHRECAACHGPAAEGTATAPSLRTEKVRKAPAAALESILRNGILRRGMPSFSHLPPQQRGQIIEWLHSLEP